MTAAQPLLLSHPRAESRRRTPKQSPPETPVLDGKLCVRVCAENRLLREALAHVLTRSGTIKVLSDEFPCDAKHLLAGQPSIFVLASRGNIAEDLELIRQLHAAEPAARILLIGMARSDHEFLRCVRAGITGYLLRDASSAEVLQGVRAVHAGEAACPGALCAALFRFVEQGAGALLLTGDGRRINLSRRERQLLPLLAEGLCNKEIGVRLSRSEQTVKNHLNRMKHKFGAKDRLELAQLYYAEEVFLKDSDGGRKNH